MIWDCIAALNIKGKGKLLALIVFYPAFFHSQLPEIDILLRTDSTYIKISQKRTGHFRELFNLSISVEILFAFALAVIVQLLTLISSWRGIGRIAESYENRTGEQIYIGNDAGTIGGAHT